jgi:hypothetical protein
MKGIIFNLLEEVVSQELGEDAWDDLLDESGFEGAYTSVGSYPDEEFLTLIAALPDSLRDGVDQRLRWFGRNSMRSLAKRYAVFFAEPDGTAEFLRTLNHIIHAEVRKLYPGADVPVFDYDLPGFPQPPGSIALGYSSPRRLCALAEGFIEGAAEQYGETVLVEQPCCMHRGDERCVLVCSITAGARAA